MRRVLPLLAAMLVPLAAFAVEPSLVIAHQGRLFDDADHAVTATVDLTFVLSTRSARPQGTGESDDIRWTETHTAVPVRAGLYSVLLGSVTPLPASTFAGMNIAFLGVTIGATELAPRLRVGSNAYAAVAESARHADVAAKADHATEAEHATSATLADRATVADALGSACVGCVKASQVDPAVLVVDPTDLPDGSIPLSKLASGSSGLDAASVKGRAPADPVANGGANAGRLVVLDASGLVPAAQLPVTTDALSVRTRVPADPLATGNANAGRLAVFDASGLLPSSALPPLPASLIPTTLTLDALSVTSLRIGNASVYAPFDGVQKPCANGLGVQTFNATSVSWSACPIAWSCTSQPSHAGCVSSSQYRSCKDIKGDTAFNGSDGVYFVDPDGTGSAFQPHQAWCDMTNEGGGWTLVVRITASPGWAHDDCNSVGTIVSPEQGSTAKWSDAAINALNADVYKLSCKTLVTYWDAKSRAFNACTAGASIRRGKNSWADQFKDVPGDDSGRGITANDNSVGQNMYYGYTSANGNTPGCHSNGWGGAGWVMAR